MLASTCTYGLHCTVAVVHPIPSFDNAEVYASGAAEEIMGLAIKELGWKRSDLVISTKIFWGGPGPNDKGLSRKHLIEGTDVRCHQQQHLNGLLLSMPLHMSHAALLKRNPL